MRAFIAVELSEEVRENLQAFQKALDFEGVKLVEPENLHITLFFLGEIDERTAAKVIEAMEKVSVPPFTLSCSGAGVFPNPNFIRVVWAGCENEQLKKIYEQLAPEMRKLRYKPEPFHAHVTVARVKDPKAKENVRAALAKFEGMDFGSCKIDRVVLKKSTLTPTGPVYEDVFEKRLG